MAQMTDELKAGYQMIFNGMLKVTKSIEMEPEYRQAWNSFLKEYWSVVKEYGNPESTKSDSPESDEWWTEYLEKANAVIGRYYGWKKGNDIDIIRLFYGFIFEIIEFAGRRKT